MKADVYERITSQMVAELEKGVRPWMKPWNAEHAARRITRPLRHNGVPYQGINVVMLWSAAVAQGFAAPAWMTYRAAQELGGHMHKGEKGNLVVYASTVTRTERDKETGEEEEQEIPFIKAMTMCRCRPSRRSAMPKATAPRWRMNAPTGRGIRQGLSGISGASGGAMKSTRWKSLSPNLAAPSCRLVLI